MREKRAFYRKEDEEIEYIRELSLGCVILPKVIRYIDTPENLIILLSAKELKIFHSKGILKHCTYDFIAKIYLREDIN